jgi:hypothetical protein
LVVVGIIQIVVFATQACFLYSSLGVTEKAATAAKDSAESYRKALALQARPVLRVRQAHLLSERPYITVQFVVANVGGSTAHIISLNHALAVGTAPPQLFGIGEPFDLGSGQKYVVTVQAGGSLLRDQTPTSLRLSGVIIYTDTNDITRETSFDRPYRFDVKIFDRIPNWDSEYED